MLLKNMPEFRASLLVVKQLVVGTSVKKVFGSDYFGLVRFGSDYLGSGLDSG
jgi:hypothetical protein